MNRNIFVIIFLITISSIRTYGQYIFTTGKIDGLTNQLPYTTIRIETIDNKNKIGIGTGFFFSFSVTNTHHKPVIVTNKHVIKDSKFGRLFFTLADSSHNPIDTLSYVININDFRNQWIMHPDPEIDLAILPMIQILNETRAKGIEIFYISYSSKNFVTEKLKPQLQAVEDIILIGYPIGIFDRHNNKPVIRRGITATHPSKRYNNKEEFMIDAACFPGLSGAPVLLFRDVYMLGTANSIKLLGVLYGGPQFPVIGEVKIVEIPMLIDTLSFASIPSNLGYVIKAHYLLDFVTLLP